MCIQRFVVILACCCLLTGCTADQIAKMDRGITDANSLAEGAKALTDSPVGAFLPPIVSQIVQVVFVLVTAVVGWWGKNKYTLLKQTAATVVKAVESMPPSQQAPALDHIKTVMTATAANDPTVTYGKMNAVVDSLKAK